MKYFITSFVLIASFSVATSQKVGDSFPESKDIISEALKLHNEGKYTEAIQKYDQVHLGDSLYDYSRIELLISLMADKKYDRALVVSAEGLGLSRQYRQDFLRYRANAFSEKNLVDSASRLYDLGSKEFTYSPRFAFEKGIMYSKNKKWTQAYDQFKQAINKKLTHSSSHFRVGQLAAESGEISLPMMAIMFYAILNNNNDNLLKGVQTIESISKGEYKKEFDIKDKLFKGSSAFVETDQIVLSKIAMTNPKYKSTVNIDYYFIKQFQIMLEQLPAQVVTDDWLMKFYIDYYSTMWKKGHYEGMVLYMLQFLNDDTKKEAKKNQKKVDAFLTWTNEFIAPLYTERSITVAGVAKKMHFWYDNDGNFEALGNQNADQKNEGEWRFFSTSGYTSAQGNYTAGQKTGTWKYYYKNGNIHKVVSYANGVPDGEYTEYYSTGGIKEKLIYKNGNLDGTNKLYFENHSPEMIVNHKNGVQHGKRIEFTNTGQKSIEYDMVDGKAQGPYFTYHPNGKVNMKSSFVNDYITADATYYNDSGGVATKASFVESKRSGTWKWFHANGKVSEEGMYDAQGQATGIWKTYHQNGVLHTESNMTKGVINGSYKEYDKEGKLLCEYIYKNKKIQSYKYFDKGGKIIAEESIKDKKVNFIYYNEHRLKQREGIILNGDEEGVWTKYDQNGNIDKTTTYKQGLRQGPEVTYYDNGKKSLDQYYKDDLLDGYFISYYKNGGLESEGYYSQDKRVGEWKFYHQNGKIYSKEYYCDGNISGVDEEYYFDGKKKSESAYHFGIFINNKQYDTTGRIYKEARLDMGNGAYRLYSLNNKLIHASFFKYGERDSSSIDYHTDGKISTQLQYRGGYKNGPYKEYFANGKAKIIGKYRNNEKDSIWIHYRSDGSLMNTYLYHHGELRKSTSHYYNSKPEIVSLYENSEREGEIIFYGIDGQIGCKRLYRNGYLIAYTYLDKSGSMLNWIPIKNETGEVKCYYANGNLSMQYKIVNGYLQGKFDMYFANGKLSTSENFVDGDMAGERTEFDENGTLIASEQYMNDEFHGWVRRYHSNGKLKKEIRYMMGTKHGPEKEYDTTGKLITSTVYLYGDKTE